VLHIGASLWQTIHVLGEFAVQNVAFHSRADVLIAGSLAACIDRAQKLCRQFQRDTNRQG
jgi:hypothetical protein